ncbi:MAG: GntR family transcriptional regulator [Gammaproteobacteria bacterium]
MAAEWNSTEPIYIQLKERVIAMMLDGTLKVGDALPSVRQVASDYQINPLTVLKAYQLLVDQHLVEKRRGLGMFVRKDAGAKLAHSERAHFLEKEWPEIAARIKRLGLDPRELLQRIEGIAND